MNKKAQFDVEKILYAIGVLLVTLFLFGMVLPLVLQSISGDYCKDYIKQRDRAISERDACYNDLSSSTDAFNDMIKNITQQRDTCEKEKYSACKELKGEYEEFKAEFPNFIFMSMTSVTITFTIVFSLLIILSFKFSLIDKVFNINIHLTKKESEKISKLARAGYTVLLIFFIFMAIIIGVFIALFIISKLI